MVKETGKKKSELSYRKRLSELQAAAERAKSAYKWEQAILMHSQALALIDDFLSKTPVQALAKRNQYLIDRFEALEQRRICYRDSGSLTGEEADLTEMAALAEKISDAARQTRVMSAQAHLFWITGCIDEAREVNKKALTQARRLRDRQQEADSLVTLGLLNWRSSEQAFSKSYVEKALELYRELGDLSGEANALRALGMVIYELGDHTRCQECYRRSLEIFRQLGDRLGEGNVLNNMQIASTDLAQRRDLCEQALATFEATGNLERLSMMYNNIGFEYTFLGLYKRALDYLQHSYELAGQIKSPFQLAYSLSSLGTAYLGLGDTQKARLFIERSLSAAQEIKDNPLESGELLELGRLELMEGHPGEALLAFQTACQILQKYESHEQASALAWQGAAYLMSGE
jgi:tetratricopeptide (TPR) repeat protein